MLDTFNFQFKIPIYIYVYTHNYIVTVSPVRCQFCTKQAIKLAAYFFVIYVNY